MELTMTYLATDRLVWVAGDKEFAACASDLPAASRKWDDSIDVGYTLVSSATGKEEEVLLFAVHSNDEGEIESWEYHPRNRNDFVLTVYND